MTVGAPVIGGATSNAPCSSRSEPQTIGTWDCFSSQRPVKAPAPQPVVRQPSEVRPPSEDVADVERRTRVEWTKEKFKDIHKAPGHCETILFDPLYDDTTNVCARFHSSPAIAFFKSIGASNYV